MKELPILPRVHRAPTRKLPASLGGIELRSPYCLSHPTVLVVADKEIRCKRSIIKANALEPPSLLEQDRQRESVSPARDHWDCAGRRSSSPQPLRGSTIGSRNSALKASPPWACAVTSPIQRKRGDSSKWRLPTPVESTFLSTMPACRRSATLSTPPNYPT